MEEGQARKVLEALADVPTAADVYPNEAKEEKKDGHFYGPSDYSPMIHSFGQVILKVDDDDYQGDSRVLYKRAGDIGYLQFGWGSCSGCDVLQSCSNIGEIQALMDELRQRIKWFSSAAEALHFFTTHDWEGDYSCKEEEQDRFVREATLMLQELSQNS